MKFSLTFERQIEGRRIKTCRREQTAITRKSRLDRKFIETVLRASKLIFKNFLQTSRYQLTTLSLVCMRVIIIGIYTGKKVDTESTLCDSNPERAPKKMDATQLMP